MKKILLTQEKFALVDDEDFEKLNQYKWFAHKAGNSFYAERKSPIVNGKRIIIKMHHEIIGYPPKGFEVDHKNGDGLFNLKSNLRFVTRRQNCQNRKNQIRRKKTSQYPGVSWDKRDQKWLSMIQINGILKNLGLFTSEFKAFNAYRQAVESLGETVIGDY